MNWGVFIFIAGILLMVMIHEAGHFSVAKLFGFKATKFFVGFGPTLWSFTRGETEYGVKALPLGGFVKILGMNPYEEVAPEDEPRSYPNKPRWQRALVLLAGSATHWPVAFLIILVTTMTIGFPTGRLSTEVAIVQRDVPGGEGLSPAAEAGFRQGDRIVAIDGRAVESWGDIRRTIRTHAGREVSFEVVRDDDTVTLDAHLGRALFDATGAPVAYAPPGGELPPVEPGQEIAGYLGIGPRPEFEREALLPAMGSSARQTWDITMLSVRGIGEVFGMVFGGELWSALTSSGERELGEGPLGIVGAGQYAGESFERGAILNLIGLIVGFVIFVGLMNLLPLPPLDGGHLAVVAWEAITKKPVDLRKLIPVAAAVISFFLLLFVAVLYLDLARPIKSPF